MNTERLREIVQACSSQLRKGPEVTTKQVGRTEVVDVYLMPHESEARPEVEKFDLHFVKVGVDKEAAEQYKKELAAILNTWNGEPKLSDGPSYIHAGAVLGDQGLALQLFAVGAALGWWHIITPALVGARGEAADKMAGNGFVMMSGFEGKLT